MSDNAKKFFDNIIVKSVILTVLPIIYGIFIPMAIEHRNEWKHADIILVINILIFFAHIIAVIIYGRREKNQLHAIAMNDEMPKELDCYKILVGTSNKLIDDNSTKLYKIVKRDENHKYHSYILDWEWMQSKGDEVVEVVYSIINRIAAEGEEFSASIILKKRENNTDGLTMLSRRAFDTSHTPRIYRAFISNTEAKGFYYKKFIDNKPTRPTILMHNKDIKKEFKDCRDVEYSQYIALPISCAGNNIIGMLQIVGYNGSKIANDKKEIEKICDKYLMPCINLIVLSDKIENIAQVVSSAMQIVSSP